MACPLCGERCTCSYAELPSAAADAGQVSILIDPEHSSSDLEQQFMASLDGPAAEPRMPEAREDFYGPGAMWRDEVASRVDAFRAKRGRPRRPEPSSMMSFDFESPQQNEVQTESTVAVASEPAWEESSTVVTMPPPVVSEPKIIEFPRSPEMIAAEKLAEELAEPVIETPRILEASPEDIAPPEFGGVSLAPITLEEHSIEIEHEPVFLRVAARGLRIFAGLVDALLVLAACAVFATIVVQMTDAVPHTRMASVLEVMVPAFLWAAYHYVFLVHAAATPGMQLAHLRLLTFDGHRVYPEQRRWRALAMVISAMSVGFGFAWAFLDPEGLCWHDKITRTYLTQKTY